MKHSLDINLSWWRDDSKRIDIWFQLFGRFCNSNCSGIKGGLVIETITLPDVRELLISVEKIAVRPGDVDQRDLMLAPALFKKLMEDRTNGVISIQILVDGKPVSIEAVA